MATFAQESMEEIATIRIELVDTLPLIWREVEAPVSITLETLHMVIQGVMNWTNSHLWEFTLGRQRFGPPFDNGWDDEPKRNAAEVPLSGLLKSRKTVIEYLYDFGDSWEHRIIVTKVRPAESGGSYPRYAGGENNAPPDDCGGLPGFYNALEALAGEQHPDHAEVMEWFGAYDEKEIDVSRIHKSLAKLARRNTPSKPQKRSAASRLTG
jgi:Plasmid pRiA4b ORF-3-like protein